MASSSNWYDFEDHIHDDLHEIYTQKNILLSPSLIPYYGESDASFAEDMGPVFLSGRPTNSKS